MYCFTLNTFPSQFCNTLACLAMLCYTSLCLTLVFIIVHVVNCYKGKQPNWNTCTKHISCLPCNSSLFLFGLKECCIKYIIQLQVFNCFILPQTPHCTDTKQAVWNQRKCMTQVLCYQVHPETSCIYIEAPISHWVINTLCNLYKPNPEKRQEKQLWNAAVHCLLQNSSSF